MDDTNISLKYQNQTEEKYPFYTPSSFRFALLNIITCGIYIIYWLFKNWIVLKKTNDLNITPFLRSIFATVFIYSFGIHVKNELLKYDLIGRWNPIVLGVSYFGIYLLYKITNPLWLLCLLSFIPLVMINNSMKDINVYNGFNRNTAKKLSWWAFPIIAILSILIALIVTNEIFEYFKIW
jgi:hypothetical protein